jgi:leader peptidase (prepilin peptidase)/N-methyltransferase
MNGSQVAFWGVVGLVTGVVVAPTASWLAGTAHRLQHRMTSAGLTTTAFLLTASRCSTRSELLVHSIFAATAVLLATVDVRVRQLPRALIWPTCTAVAGALVMETISSGDTTELSRAVTAAAVLTSGYLAIAVASRGGLGAGDVRLAVLVGGVLGWHGWPALILGSVLGFVTTGVAAALLAARHRMPGALPHGPGMLLGAFVALLL